MPHLVILYTPNLEPKTDLTALCRALADAMLAVRDEGDQIRVGIMQREVHTSV